MKIAFINTVNLEENGISTFILNNSYILSQWGIKVTVIVPNEVKNELRIALRLKNIKLVELPMRSIYPQNYFFKLMRILKKEKFDVVHVNGNSTTMAVELLAAYFAGIKLRIAHSHNTTTDHKKINKLLRPLFNIVTNGRIACNVAAGKWLFPHDKFLVIKNGINLSHFKFNKQKRNKYRDKLNLTKDSILLGHVGRFNQQKNQQFLINLITKLDSKYHLLLIGSGMNYHKLRAKVSKDPQLNKRIFFTGPVEDTAGWLNSMDIFLLPSLYEGQPYTLVEATATGLNAIVSDSISRENDIANNIIFETITQNKNWIEVIRKQDFNKDRGDLSSKYINVLRMGGFDTIENAKILLNFYKQKLLKL